VLIASPAGSPGGDHPGGQGPATSFEVPPSDLHPRHTPVVVPCDARPGAVFPSRFRSSRILDNLPRHPTPAGLFVFAGQTVVLEKPCKCDRVRRACKSRGQSFPFVSAASDLCPLPDGPLRRRADSFSSTAVRPATAFTGKLAKTSNTVPIARTGLLTFVKSSRMEPWVQPDVGIHS
jgi:hypothetical protein